MERKVYLTNTDIEEAVSYYLGRLDEAAAGVKIELVDVREALGRVTAKPVFARVSAPNHNAAAMDGIMAVAERTFSASETNPVDLKPIEDFDYVNTGQLIRDPYDCVILVEDLQELEDGKVRITAAASPWQHIRPIGEDIVAGEMVLPENHRIRPIDIGAVLNSGVRQIEVYERIRIGIMPTGNEITEDYDHLEPGNYFDTNSWTFCAMVEEWGGIPDRISPVPDREEDLKSALMQLLERNHIVIVNAGSSAGIRDYTAHLVEEMGELVFHGLAIRPGKPTVLGIVDGKPVIGVPGFPGSAFLAFEEIVGPVFRKLQRTRISQLPRIDAVVSKRVVSSLKYREYIRVKVGKVDEKLIATPLSRGAGVTMSLVRADGLMIIPRNSEGYEAGETVSVELTRDMSDIENTIVSIGSHDLIMDYMATLLEKREAGPGEPKIHLSSAHVGSMGGILALSRGEAHMAPIHLLDEQTGEYNTSYIEKYLGNRKIALVKGVKRQQGFMVAKGNPKNIRSIEDLARKDVVFVNRQKGSGTRILTDYLLKKNHIDNSLIKGYDRDMTTHMAVAAAVSAGTADVGVGVFSAAKAMGLDFIPIGVEEYDFAIPEQFMETEMIRAFLEVLRSEDFRKILEELGGYEYYEEQ
ncbi:MAG TPA: molybdopterin biosynthesis protein [Clostridiales bacterium UBA9856]|jgi:putative molybdopterin biosynthesis protein|nr:molybdopterin biosynthesis protein [Clostridiales bacterium UBA9856]HOA43293.1 molybdopterin biosynthesis protein [Bacillota bacterium]HPZ59964.1 molybdopterin biosynthesis protein [Bacillota bacterium]